MLNMLAKRNFTPQQAALISTIPIGIIAGVAAFLYTKAALESVIFWLIISLTSYIIANLVIKRFIDRKIKLIYKLIYQTKASKKEEFYYKTLLPQKTVSEVSEDVETWAIHHKAELETLRENEKYRKEFLLNLSHELKTPIFAIQGYIDTLLNGAIDNDKVNRRFLENTSRNVDRMVNLVDDLDEITSLESGAQVFQKEQFIIQDLIREVCDSLSIKSEKKKIKCSIKAGCEAPLTVFADKEKIRMVLINLIDNAIKYGKTGGTIEGSAYKMDSRNILVEISDDGYGIATEHLARIFERFYRTDNARNRSEGGSGLGLSIAKHIIEAHNSAIHVRSKINVGSTFGFILEDGKAHA